MSALAFALVNFVALAISSLILMRARFEPGPAGEYPKAAAWFLVVATSTALAMCAVLALT